MKILSQISSRLFTKQSAVITILLLCLVAWFNAFIQDDAFISFKYARNLAEGRGLVWNFDERIEGYTNFLWTIIVAVAIYIGFEPVIFTKILGILLYGLTLYTIYRITFNITASLKTSILAVIFCGLNFTFSSYATGGLETQLQTCLFMGALFTAFKLMEYDKKNINFLLLCLFSLLLILTRLDSVLLITPLFLFIIYNNHRAPLLIFLLLAPILAGLVIYFSWKYSFYGKLLPNTFYAKTGKTDTIGTGLYYVYVFLISYWLLPVVILLLFKVRQLIAINVSKLSILLITVSLWILYIIWAGGDFMEFRFFVLVIPLLFISLAIFITIIITSTKLRLAMTTFIILGSISHALLFGRIFFKANVIERIALLNFSVMHEGHGESWIQTGKKIEENFKGTYTSFALTPVGAIGYYTNQKIVDMHGLTDSNSAKNGRIISNKPGHSKLASMKYLSDQKVNFIICHSFLHEKTINSDIPVRLENLRGFIYGFTEEDKEILKGKKVVEMELEKGLYLTAVYLIPTAQIDYIISSKGWTVSEISK